MKLKKGIISLLAGLSVLASGIFTSCGNPSGAEKGNENQVEDFTPKPEIEQSDDGIKLTWGSVPSNIKHIRIENWSNDRNYTVFEINDLSKYNSVTDEYVDEGKDYEYRIVYLDEDYRWIKASDWFTVKAEGGKGELTYNAVTTDVGIKLSGDLTTFKNITATTVERFSNNAFTRIEIWQPDEDSTFTDKYVNENQEYEYKLILKLGGQYQDKNNVDHPAEDLVMYPRFKNVKVKATSGSGEIKATTLPELSYDDDNKKITLTKEPEFSEVPSSWGFTLNYSSSQYGWNQFGYFYRDGNKTQFENEIQRPDGLWTFEECWFNLYFENFRYDFGEYNLPSLPESIALNVDVTKIFMPLLKATDNGVEIKWQCLPENTKKLEVRDANNGNTLFEVNDLSTVTSVTDKYVTAGKKYQYYFVARNQYGDWIQQSEFVTCTAKKGSGEFTLSAEATSDGNKLSVSALPAQYDSLEIYKRKKKATGNWDSINFYSTENNFPFIDKFVTKDVEYDYTLSIQIGKSKSWNNGLEIPANDVLEYPRYNSITVKANGGAGEVKITNKPVATYADSKVTYTTEPVIGDFGQRYYSIEFNYCKNNNYHWSLYHYESQKDNPLVASMNIQNAPAGEWSIAQYWITLYFDTYNYAHWSNDLSMLGGLPVITK